MDYRGFDKPVSSSDFIDPYLSGDKAGPAEGLNRNGFRFRARSSWGEQVPPATNLASGIHVHLVQAWITRMELAA